MMWSVLGVLCATSLTAASTHSLHRPQERSVTTQGSLDTSGRLTKSSGLDETKWLQSRAQAEKLCAKLNATEKASIVTGSMTGLCIEYIAPVESIGFGGLCLQDGPAAIRLADLASVFPAGVTVAATWDKDMMYERGSALAQEFKGKGAHVALGPVAGPLGRTPWGGRNWEGFSPDPFLTGVAMDQTIRAIQSEGVQANAKHIIGNEQETQRKPTVVDGKRVEAYSANIDDRTLHELYLWPFADAVHAGVASVTCAYNRVNSTSACENEYILTDILKGELGFEGYVVSDFFASFSGIEAANAGLDMNQPGPISATDLTESLWGSNLVSAIANGSLSEARLDDMVRRILTPYLYLGQDKDYPSIDPSSQSLFLENFGLLQPGMPTPVGRDVRGNHSRLIRSIGAAGTVLLKNTNNTLPLKNPNNIGVFGNDAPDVSTGLIFPDNGFEIGTVVIGGGSGSGHNSFIVPPLDAIKDRARRTGSTVQYITNNTALAAGITGIYPWPDICLVFLKGWATEGMDLVSLEADYNSTLVVENVASICPKKTVVITHSAGPNTMPWASNPNVVAILAAHYPGEESGNSIVDVLYGDVNPSGRLPYTIANNETDYGVSILNVTGSLAEDSSAWNVNFTEGQFIDYRHFDANEIAPLYEFGFGLSYTTFELASNMSVSKVASSSISPYPAHVNSSLALGGNPNLWKTLVTCSSSVKNTGSVRGAAVVQLYVSLPQDNVPVGTPIRVLRGFEKVPLQPGETKRVSFSLTRRDLSYWDIVAQDWKIPSGEIGVSLGFSSRDLPYKSSVKIL
ncbi:glycosyl hydrolase family 3 N terminal domain-containing protein [Talaromyces proteolyticus]|uniref:Probable beta-glucosidase G n=1 Tax=Talaromyces proteolyticus TaxID=1131652 RepID=A0AAD4Q347_9EURO|nr:glycosyl hydrolase family 3 N terminal domain-containing protein [Talaromyces proteolyticus]KAH8701062.1 glycosyl hydrolase family 3 N terminal domain-containing protein [Talaromyces proteolyticus]